ncbi:sigma-70 family RNA polymerase sigma factor [Actinomadura mexicana]|uniref:DNA-directed RNA polymerase specialized sigma subunit, sigma24 family n=1 Tax=Actinomadura mexicana TaxID=134959 RepID=A0A239GWR4_9ACTN|nr:sigma-70 family RNA polymerase sigma factor [Actinomadura mexicana]SNS72963.1 hypothetical protein SAMN06265355_12642 [Actinomadura mexicana]
MSTVQGETPGPHVPTGTGPEGQGHEVEVPQDEAELAIDLDLAEELIADAEAELVPEALKQSSSEGSKSDRLQADHLMVKMVIEEGLGGPREEYLLQELVRYARPVLKALLRDGRVFAKCKRLHRPVSDDLSFLDWSDLDREEIAQDMICDALPVFKKSVFEQGRWSPEKGASLNTYFVNACVLQFPAIYRKWREQRRRMVSMEDEQAGLPMTESHDDPARRVIVQDRLDRALETVDLRTRKALAYYAAGFTMKEAAERSGMTPKQLEGVLARLRKKQAGERNSRPDGREGQC